jgi:hypothetical protein
VSRPSFGEFGGQDPYAILELPSGASDADIRAARKRLLRKFHPDLPNGDLRRTQLITAAADLLLDPLRRIGYYDLRDEDSRRSVFATAGFADEWRRTTRPGHADGASADGASVDGASVGPAQPIRPTFVTPPGAGWEPPPPDAAGRGSGQEPGREPPPVGADHGYGSPAGPPAAASRWNALAVASVVAILTWTPIPLVLGLLALVQIRRSGQRGKRPALIGVIAGAIFVLIYVYILVLS